MGLGLTLPLLSYGQTAHSDPAPPDLHIYGRLPHITKAAISPDGRRVVMVVNDPGGFWLEDRDLETGTTARYDLDGNMVPILMWADNQNVLAVTSQTNHVVDARYEAWVGFIINIRTGRRYRLYSDMPEYSHNLVGDFQRVNVSGNYAVTAANLSAGAANYVVDYSTALYAFNSQNYRHTFIDEDTRRILNWAVRGDGQAVARCEYNDEDHVWRLRHHGDRGWRVIYATKTPLDLPFLKGVGRDGKSALLFMREGPHRDHYVEIDENGVFGAPLVSNRSLHFPIFDPKSGFLVGFGHEDGLEHYVFYDPAYIQLQTQLKNLFPEGRTELVDIAEDLTQVIILTSGKGNPGSYYVYDSAKGISRPIGLTYPDLPPEWVFEKQAISYSASDGLAISGFLTLPRRDHLKNMPLVVLPHGGPESFDDPQFDFIGQALASRGYMVLQPNFRGSSGFGDDFTAKGYGQFGRRMQSDLSDGVRYLVAQGLADPKRVAIVGASYGGYAALAGVAFEPDVYNCAVSISGYCDIPLYMADILRNGHYNKNNRTVLYWQRYLGDAPGWNDISPIAHLNTITAPVLLIHSQADTIVPFEQSEDMFEAMKKAGKHVNLVALEDADHYLSMEPTRIQTLNAVVDFLLRNNPPG